jgi:hypothetical protein
VPPSPSRNEGPSYLFSDEFKVFYKSFGFICFQISWDYGFRFIISYMEAVLTLAHFERSENGDRVMLLSKIVSFR